MEENRERAAGPSAPAAPGAEPDYYFENGCLVFTAAYHLRRGSCCESGCRHCPYGFEGKSPNGGGGPRGGAATQPPAT